MSALPAVIVTTDLVVVSRHLTAIEELLERGLTPLMLFGPQTSAATLADVLADPRHPLSSAPTLHVPDYALDTVLRAITPWTTGFDIRGVLNLGELFVYESAVVAECLGLPGPGAHAARVCRNKLLQRLAVPELAPRWTSVDGEPDPAWSHYPAVLKPAGRMSSSGVVRVDGPEQARSALPAYPLQETLLIEEQVDGPEVSVETLVFRGRIAWVGVTAKSTNESSSHFFTETGHTSPAELADCDQHIVLAANEHLLRTLRFRDGMSHAEFRLCAGRAVLMEVAARPPGDAITRLWHMACGRPLEPALVDLALGVRPFFPQPLRRARQVYLDHPHGELADVRIDPPYAAPVSWIAESLRWPEYPPVDESAAGRCCGVVVSRHRGEQLGPVRDSGERCASVVIDCPLPDDIDVLAKEWTARVCIDVA